MNPGVSMNIPAKKTRNKNIEACPRSERRQTNHGGKRTGLAFLRSRSNLRPSESCITIAILIYETGTYRTAFPGITVIIGDVLFSFKRMSVWVYVHHGFVAPSSPTTAKGGSIARLCAGRPVNEPRIVLYLIDSYFPDRQKHRYAWRTSCSKRGPHFRAILIHADIGNFMQVSIGMDGV